jgi:hypothetical protein
MRRSIGISLASLITSACAIGWAAQFGWAADHGPVRVDHRNLPTRGCNRGEHPMMVFDREGNFLRSWREGQYPPAHGVHMAPDDTMFLTIDGEHFVRKVTLDGAPMASRYCSKIVHPPSIR